MSSRRQQLIDAAVAVFKEGGVHALTHRGVDAKAGLPSGSTSNVFRTRAALLEGLAEGLFAVRQADGGVHDEELSLAWLELLLLARRDPVMAAAVAPGRQEMVALLGANRTDELPLSDAQLAALLTGLEFGALVTGCDLRAVLDLLRRAATQNDPDRARDDTEA